MSAYHRLTTAVSQFEQATINAYRSFLVTKNKERFEIDLQQNRECLLGVIATIMSESEEARNV